MVNRLVSDGFDAKEGKTEGIDIHQWQVRCDGQDIRLNVRDFGGQEIMHATHQFFLTRRSLYLLVLDARQGEAESRIEYWLKLIQSFAGDSPIRGFAKRVSCQTGEGIPELRSMIEVEVAALDHIHDELSTSWFAVKSELEELKDDYIPYAEYEKMCAEHGIEDDTSLRTLVSFLHDLGIVLHLADHPILADTSILNPDWVIKGVYQIINSDILRQKGGVLKTGDLPEILKPRRSYPNSRHLFITKMMRRFELCFEYPGQTNQRFLVPDLLPREEPDTGPWDDSLAFQ